MNLCSNWGKGIENECFIYGFRFPLFCYREF